MSIEMDDNKNLSIAESLNVGSVAIEQARAVAEVKGQISIAKMFPRDLLKVREAMLESCKHSNFAKEAFYSLPRGKDSITGPSIRFAEELARCMGNFEYGHRELSRSEGKSEIEVYAWDKEQNNRSIRQITVEHSRDKSGGNVKLVYSRDIDDRIANVASKQVRGRILAIIPKWIMADAIEACKETLSGGSEKPMSERISIMVDKFSKVGVNSDMLTNYFGTKLDSITQFELNQMFGIYGAINNGEKKELFFSDDEQTEELKQLQEQATKRGLSMLEQRRLDKANGKNENAGSSADGSGVVPNVVEGEVVSKNAGTSTENKQAPENVQKADNSDPKDTGNNGAKEVVSKGNKVRPSAKKDVPNQGVEQGQDDLNNGNEGKKEDTVKKQNDDIIPENTQQNQNKVDNSVAPISNNDLSGNQGASDQLPDNGNNENMFAGDEDIF